MPAGTRWGPRPFVAERFWARPVVVGLTIHRVFLPHEDPGASLRFYRDTLGFDVREDDGTGPMRRIVVGARIQQA